MNICKFALVVAVLVLSTGCAVGNQYALGQAQVTVPNRGQGAVVVAAVDQRNQVIGEGTSPDVVGVQRAGFGNPWEVTTASGEPLATEVSRSIAQALTHAGYSVTIVPASVGRSSSEVISTVVAKNQGKGIVVSILNFWSDTYNNVTLHYDITLTVVDASGNVLAEATSKEAAELGGSFMNPPKHAKKAVPEAYGRILGQLLSDAKVQAALSGSAGIGAPPHAVAVPGS
jgi:hypothetical protein